MTQASKSSTASKRSGSNSRSSAKPRSGSSKGRSSANSTAARNGRSSGSKARSSRGSGRKAASSRNGASSAVSSAGQTVAAAASKAKTPLIAGGAALAGAAGTLLIKNRMSTPKGPIQKLRAASLPKPSLPKFNGEFLNNLDLGRVKSTAERVSSLGQQAADIAAAAEKTNKKHG
jgi:hypothetical protein